MAIREDRSFGSLISELTFETTTLFRKEIQLAKAELREKLSQAGSGITALAIGGAILFIGIQALVATAIIALALVLDWWLSALIVGAVLAVIGGITLMVGMSSLRTDKLKPQRTIATMRDNAQWAREQLR